MRPRDGGSDLRFLFEASRRLNQAADLAGLLEEVRELTLEAVGAEACSLLLWNEDRTRLEFHLAYNRLVPDPRLLALESGEGLAGWISHHRETTISNDVDSDPRYRHRIDREIGFHTRTLLGFPIFRGNTIMGVCELHNSRDADGFTPGDAALCEALADQMAVALDNALVVRRLQREKAENEALYRISLLLNERLELTEILDTFLDQLALVIPYQAGAIHLLHQDSQDLEWFAYRGYEPGLVELVRLKLGQGAVGWVANAGVPLVIPDVKSDHRYLDVRDATRSEIVVPVVNEGRVIGVINLESDVSDAYRSSDLRILQSFANQAGVSIQRAQFYKELTEKHRMEDDLHIAAEIQRLFLPEDEPGLPGYDLAGLNLPSRLVSGDFYDFIRITDGHMGLAIGDVSGKGIPAALIMATVRASLRAEIRNRYAISEILSKVNYLLWESTRPETFATAVYGVLDLKRRLFTYSNAGHNPPLLIGDDTRPRFLEEGGVILGPFRDSSYPEATVSLASGDVLVFYTDGVTEAISSSGVEFGQERLAAAVWESRARSAAEICRAIADLVRMHSGSAVLGDDLTLVVLRVG